MTSSYREVRLAVVGYGYWGAKHVRVLSNLPGVHVTVVDTDARRLAEALARCAGISVAEHLDDVLPDVDAVVVATPPSAHHPVAMRCLSAGVPVLVEKPMATSVREAQEMVDAAEQAGVQLMVGHTFEYNPAVWKLKEIISSGVLGRVLYIDAARLSLGRYQRDCNVVWDLAPHDISIISYLLGEVPKRTSVWAERNIGGAQLDVAYIRLQFQASTAFVRVSWLHPNKVRRVTVVGERKMAVYDDLSDNERVRIYDIGVDPGEIDATASPAMPVSYRTGDIVSPYIEFTEPLLLQDEHFVECVRTGCAPRTPGQRGLDIVRVLAATDLALDVRDAVVPAQSLVPEIEHAGFSLSAADPIRASAVPGGVSAQ